MKAYSNRLRLAVLCAAWMTGAAAAQEGDSAGPCEGSGLLLEDIPNSELRGVLDFVEATELIAGTTGTRLCRRNLAVAAILSRLDIDGDGVPDNAPDTDGDGLPDNWETGGFEALSAGGELVDRVVFYPAPSPVVPGTPPTPIFTRLAIATDALNPDTDGDGLSDFVEVFGLRFIDDDRDGRLGGAVDWVDRNNDGLPSPGEFPIDNTGEKLGNFDFLHDFDGFVFTDPTNSDTDGDGQLDGVDNDPLINPRSFGNLDLIIVRFNAEGNADIDQDGLGNGMDMGNDIVSGDGEGVQDFQVIDNPGSIPVLLDLFRRDLLQEGVIPESQIEDLFGADWDGNGLWRSTDVRTWSLLIDERNPELTPPAQFFTMDPDDPASPKFYAEQTFDDIAGVLSDDGFDLYGGGVARQTGRGIGMGWQDLLKPTRATPFIPDPRVWAILYAWRMPGFDIDGDGFVGAPNLSSTISFSTDADGVELASIALKTDPATGEFALSDAVSVTSTADDERPFDDRISFVGGAIADNDEPTLDGLIEVPGLQSLCGAASATIFGLAFLGLIGMRIKRRR